MVRREKQRQANAGRAQKMHDARLVWEQNAELLEALPLDFEDRPVHIGFSGWFY